MDADDGGMGVLALGLAMIRVVDGIPEDPSQLCH